jgi:hypothetical protein
VNTARYFALREEAAGLVLIARDMHAAGVTPENDLDLEPIQRRLLATRHPWGMSFYYVIEITTRVLDLRAQAAGFPDCWAQALAGRARRAKQTRSGIDTRSRPR